MDGVQDATHADLGIEPGGGALGVGHLEEVENQRKNLVQTGVEGEQAGRHLVAGLGRRVGVGDGEVVPQQRQDGQQRNGPAMGDARGPPHRDAPSDGRADELLAEPALAHPGFADHAHHLKAAFDRLCEGVLQRSQLPFPTHQPRGTQRARRPGGHRRRKRSAQHVHAQRLPGSFHRLRAEVLEAEPAVDQPGRVLGQIRPTRLRHRLHALGQPHGVTQRRRVQRDVVTDAAHDHLTGIEPNTNLEVDVLITAQLFRVGGDRPGDVPGGMARSSGVVLLGERERRTEP